MVTRTLGAASLAFAFSAFLAPVASAQVTATCQLNAQENRVHSFVPLEGTLKSTEQMLSPDLPFMQYLPNGHDPTKKWPVIIFLHGIGEVGGNLRKVTEHSLPRVVESPEWDWPFIVLSPVLPTASWHPRTQLVEDIFDYAVNTLGGDPNRLYLTGVSHGGAGTLAIGIELADKVAALWPVCPGGDADDYNWDMRAAIAGTPTMFLVGTEDGEYDGALNWATQLEGSGAPMFTDYSIPTAEEHEDTIPKALVEQTNAFVTYQNLPHDIWHAAYGNFCTGVLTTYKTTQYEWLLAQSLDGSPFVDPRDPNAPMGGSGGGGAGGAATAGTGGSGGASAGGGGAPSSGGSVGMAGTTSTLPPGGSGGASGFMPPNGSQPAADAGCGCVVAGKPSSSAGLGLLALLGLAGALSRRARRVRH